MSGAGARGFWGEGCEPPPSSHPVPVPIAETECTDAAVSIARFVSEIPADTEHDDGGSKVAAMKQGRWVRRLIHATDYQPDSAFAPEPRGGGEGVNGQGAIVALVE